MIVRACFTKGQQLDFMFDHHLMNGIYPINLTYNYSRIKQAVLSLTDTSEHEHYDAPRHYDVLVLTFVVTRSFLYYLYVAYIPIMLLMVFNNASYWIPDTALPARVTLIVTTFLTSTYILQVRR